MVPNSGIDSAPEASTGTRVEGVITEKNRDRGDAPVILGRGNKPSA